MPPPVSSLTDVAAAFPEAGAISPGHEAVSWG